MSIGIASAFAANCQMLVQRQNPSTVELRAAGRRQT